MLEAHAHHQLKALLRREGRRSQDAWPHQLSLCRLVARSLRRCDHTLVRLTPGSGPGWLLGLLVPLALSEASVALVLSPGLRQRLLEVELPRLAAAGLALPCHEGPGSEGARLWLLSVEELLQAWRGGTLGGRQLVIPEAEQLDARLRAGLAMRLVGADWDRLARAHPAAAPALAELHGRLSRQVMAHPGGDRRPLPLAPEDEAPLRQLLGLFQPLPEPWQRWQASGGDAWVSWAALEAACQHQGPALVWSLHRQPLEPLHLLNGLFEGRGAVLVAELAGSSTQLTGNGDAGLGFIPNVCVDLGDTPLSDPLPVYAPLRQPLPNSPRYGEHLLDQCRRLVLGQAGLSLILIDDEGLRLSLTSGLAAEFGSRVVHESSTAESNGVICARWSWWLDHQGLLPLPCQIVVGLLPIASLEDPLTAAQVLALRRQGRDWFRERLLPDGLTRLQLAITGLRGQGGRLAILDGRLRGRSWGRQVLGALEPWVNLRQLLPP
ncbi:helicase [Cyanobium sp. NIES-981]|uniref:helicase n=1 Tax=Cyanobium sp. NIES-981 TaxID=1851505 RepID=UPI0007DD5BA5|nr:helicase [Cyanobium sp. NIES-981]SBO43543.1 Carboxyl-terminal protease [Cyanobium sp. NIES-981]